MGHPSPVPAQGHASGSPDPLPLLRRRFARVLLCLGAGVLLLASSVAEAQSVAGIWRMERYEGGGSTGPARGLLLLADGHFSLTYSMEECGKPTAGRAHAGSYEVSGEKLIFNVEWNIENVGGKASVSQRPAQRETRFTLRGDELTVHFENGAVQVFRRVREER